MALDDDNGGLIDPRADLPGALEVPQSPADRHREYAQAARGTFVPNTVRAIRADTAVFTAWCLAAGCAEPAGRAAERGPLRGRDEPDQAAGDGPPLRVQHRAAAPSSRAPEPGRCTAWCSSPCGRMNRSQGREQRQAEAMTRRLVDRMLDAAGDDRARRA